ncbi:MAG: hypothetical protein Fur0032_16950 [Terrimicrobiaceae bacterium]
MTNKFPRWLREMPHNIRWALGLLSILLVAILLFGDNPWDVKVAAGSRWKISDYVAMWFWIAAALNALLVAGLAVTWRWWAAPLDGNELMLFQKKTPRWFLPAVLAAAAVLAVLAWLRLDQSLWHDEANRVKNALVGEYRHDKSSDGGDIWKFRKAPWIDTFFYYRMPNHCLQSVLSRASHEIWLAFARPSGFPVNETALRFPLWLAGTGGVLSLAFFLRAIGQPGGAVAAAWILALHPWYLRYASEARGYSLVMAFLPLTLLALLRAMESGRTRWWVVYAISQTAMAYAYVTSIYILIILNICAPAVIWSLPADRTHRATILRRWLVANIASAAIFLQLFLPCLPQLLDYVRSDKGTGVGNVMNLFWMQNFLAHLLAGLPWTFSQNLDSAFVELWPWAESHPAWMALIGISSAGLVVLGLRWAIRCGPFTSMTAAVFILPAILCYADSKARGAFLFEWYLIFLLPGAVALATLGGADFIRTPADARLRPVLAVLMISLIPAYGLWTMPQRAILLTRSIQPYREAVLLTRPSLDPMAPGQENIITTAFHARPLVYDPRIVMVKDVDGLQQLMDRATRENKDLFVNLSYLNSTRTAYPELLAYVKKGGHFEEVEELIGLHPSLSTQVFRYVR